jgi:hypothetical protein
MAGIPVYVEGWDPGYGSSARFDADSDGTSELVEDGTELRFHDGRPPDPDIAVYFVDGVRRIEGFLSFLDPDTGDVMRGLAGAYGVGAVLFPPHGTGEYAHIVTRRLAVICGGHSIELPDVPGGWHWDVLSVASPSVDNAEAAIHEQMRQGEARLARDLAVAGGLTVVDGNLNYVRSIDGRFVGCVKTHSQHYLGPAERARVPELGVGQRTSLFTVRDDCYAAYVRLAARGPHHPPWHGIVRVEVSQSLGLGVAVGLADGAAGMLPHFAGREGHDPRAPQNLQPIGALERHLRHLLGPAHFALRALREAVTAHHPLAAQEDAT